MKIIDFYSAIFSWFRYPPVAISALRLKLLCVLLLFGLPGCEYDFGSRGVFASENVLFVLTSDNIASAGFSIVSGNNVQNGNENLHTDAIVRYRYPHVYVVNRLGRDNLQLLNAQDDYRTLAELSLVGAGGTPPNPQDIVFFGDRAFVSCYGTNELLLVNTLSLKIEDSLDLSTYGYRGSACPSFMHYHEKTNRVLVALQRLDSSNMLPSDYSTIIAVDPDSQAVVDSIRLRYDDIDYKNPYTRFKSYDEDTLLVACAGHFKMTGNTGDDGAIVMLKPGDLRRIAVLVTEEQFGADIVDFEYCGDSVYAVTLDAQGGSALVRYDTGSAQVQTVLTKGGRGYLWRIDQKDGLLYICNRDVNDAGVLVYDTAARGFLYGGALRCALPPADIVFIGTSAKRADYTGHR